MRHAPESLVVWGVDKPCDASHELYDARIHLRLRPAFLRSLDRRGVLVPVACRDIGFGLEVVDGRQRVRGAREVNRRRSLEGRPPLEVPVVVLEGDLETPWAELVLELNAQRQELDRASLAPRLLDLVANGATARELAPLVGRHEHAVENWVKLQRNGSEALLKAVAEKRVPVRSAVEVARMPRHRDQAGVLAWIEKTGETRVREVRAEVRRRRGRLPTSSPSSGEGTPT